MRRTQSPPADLFRQCRGAAHAGGTRLGGAQSGAQFRELYFEAAIEAAERGFDDAAAGFDSPIGDQREASPRQAGLDGRFRGAQHRQIVGIHVDAQLAFFAHALQTSVTGADDGFARGQRLLRRV